MSQHDQTYFKNLAAFAAKVYLINLAHTFSMHNGYVFIPLIPLWRKAGKNFKDVHSFRMVLDENRKAI